MNDLYTPDGEKIRKVLAEHQMDYIPLSEYPRPSMVRKNSHIILNGFWDFSTYVDGKKTKQIQKILVPFAPESLLSGINKHFPEGTELCYERKFFIPDGFNKGKILLHFGAVDQKATVYVNGNKIGEHIGGYSPFTFDISKYVSDGQNDLKVVAIDNLNDKTLPYGKQKIKRKGMWYTPVSGIWQTVWLETVSNDYIKDINIQTNENKVTVEINGCINGFAVLKDKSQEKEILKCKIQNGKTEFTIDKPIYWSPENPFLYYLTVISSDASEEQIFDEVETYFAFRTLKIKEVDGTSFLCLNGKPYYFHGMLDQGYWSDGIYTPATYKCFVDDILLAKSLGFNTLRKHIKMEPQRFYYECDKLGVVVFQDMINNGDYSFIRDTALPTIGVRKLNDKKLHKDKKTREEFKRCTNEIIENLKKHPSICLWTIFNEGWGQFDGNSMFEFVSNLDNSRFIDTASGWFYCSQSHVESVHKYFSEYKHKRADKPVILSEFGGYSYKINEHSFNLDNTYGYGKINSEEQFNEAVLNLYKNQIVPAIKDGLSSDIYTQISDVEDETNGFITYDRKHLKISTETMNEIKNLINAEIGKIVEKIN